jgi:hypothetical protein
LGLPGHDVEPARAHVAVAETADAVQQLHVAQVAVGEDLLDRERSRQQIERGESLAGACDLTRHVVTGAQRVGQIVSELVADHQA